MAERTDGAAVNLKHRTTYENNGGARVCNAGPTGEKHGNQPPLYWSIQGNHYAEDGRFVSWSRSNPAASKLDDMGLRRVLLPAEARDSIKGEITTKESQRLLDWGVNVSAAKIGARVRYCGHHAVFVADIWCVGNVNVVRANGSLMTEQFLDRSEDAWDNATHQLNDHPTAGYWRPSDGIFVVPASQVIEL